jgi:hypothetical protein
MKELKEIETIIHNEARMSLSNPSTLMFQIAHNYNDVEDLSKAILIWHLEKLIRKLTDLVDCNYLTKGGRALIVKEIDELSEQIEELKK